MNLLCCLPGNTYSGRFLANWTAFNSFCSSNGITILLSQNYDPNVHFVRAKCLGGNVANGIEQKPFNGQLAYDYCLWIDSDIVFTPRHFETLLNAKKEMIGGLYLMQDTKHYAAVSHLDLEYFRANGSFQFLTPNDIAGKMEPMPVAYTGFGFLLMKHGVIEKLPYPWFRQHIIDFGNGMKEICAEDVSFCLSAKGHGIQAYIDPTVVVGHEKQFVI